MPINHAKTNAIADWTQAQLDAAIVAGQFAPGTTLANIVLPSDWNAPHTIVLTTAEITPILAATGGTITTDGDYKVHDLTASGPFVVTSGGGLVEYLVVAAGGGGGSSGGGAGGVRHGHKYLTPGSYDVVVGSGGLAAADGGNSITATNGDYSAFDDVIALGGQRGYRIDSDPGYSPCGSGCGAGAASIATHPGGVAMPGQGNDGGATNSLASPYPAGGGGGATQAGSPGSGSTGGKGGDGYTSGISGSSQSYSRGGGGGVYGTGTGGAPGTNGAGTGSDTNSNASSGGSNTGDGGGGAGQSTVPGNGGSGRVILRYKFQ